MVHTKITSWRAYLYCVRELKGSCSHTCQPQTWFHSSDGGYSHFFMSGLKLLSRWRILKHIDIHSFELVHMLLIFLIIRTCTRYRCKLEGDSYFSQNILIHLNYHRLVINSHTHTQHWLVIWLLKYYRVLLSSLVTVKECKWCFTCPQCICELPESKCYCCTKGHEGQLGFVRIIKVRPSVANIYKE